MSQPAVSTKPVKASPVNPEDRIESSLRPVRKGDWSYEHARHLLWRAGFGGDESQVRWLAEIGAEKAVDALLNVEKVPSEAVKPEQFDAGIMAPPNEEERQMARRAQQMQDEDTLDRKSVV